MTRVLAFYAKLHHSDDPGIISRMPLPWIEYLRAMQFTAMKFIPNCDFCVLTDEHTHIPSDLKTIRFPLNVQDDIFRSTIRLQNAYIQSSNFDQPTVLTGSDVVFRSDPWQHEFLLNQTKHQPDIVIPHWYMPKFGVSWINSAVLVNPYNGARTQSIREFFNTWLSLCEKWNGEWPDLNSLTQLLGLKTTLNDTFFNVCSANILAVPYGYEKKFIMSAMKGDHFKRNTAIIDFNGGPKEKARLIPTAQHLGYNPIIS
jgi:hypothetical protein